MGGTRELSYADTGFPVRDDVLHAHRRLLAHIAAPGTWWTGEERVAIASEARRARSCELCRQRKAALSPYAVEGVHDADAKLPGAAIDVVHRLVTDPGRFTRAYYDSVIADGLEDGKYVELVALTAFHVALDVFAVGLGAELAALPIPLPGQPSRRRPTAARPDGAWVDLIPVGEAGGADAAALYSSGGMVPNIGRALSLVPEEVRALLDLSQTQYMPMEQVADPRLTPEDRALDRPQIELLASRVSAINECFY